MTGAGADIQVLHPRCRCFFTPCSRSVDLGCQRRAVASPLCMSPPALRLLLRLILACWMLRVAFARTLATQRTHVSRASTRLAAASARDFAWNRQCPATPLGQRNFTTRTTPLLTSIYTNIMQHSSIDAYELSLKPTPGHAPITPISSPEGQRAGRRRTHTDSADE